MLNVILRSFQTLGHASSLYAILYVCSQSRALHMLVFDIVCIVSGEARKML